MNNYTQLMQRGGIARAAPCKVKWKEDEEGEDHMEIGLEAIESGVKKGFYLLFMGALTAILAMELMMIILRVLDAGQSPNHF